MVLEGVSAAGPRHPLAGGRVPAGRVESGDKAVDLPRRGLLREEQQDRQQDEVLHYVAQVRFKIPVSRSQFSKASSKKLGSLYSSVCCRALKLETRSFLKLGSGNWILETATQSI
jgi:hypothetical protein